MSYKTPMSRARGLGAAKDGVGHWWSQRVTAVALILLTLLAIPPFAGAVGEDWETVRGVYGSTFNAIVAMLFFVTAFQHLRLGLQVVIEDYVHAPALRTGLLLANTLLCWGFGLAGVFAVAKLAFGA